MDKIILSEAQEQIILVNWLEAMELKFTSVPNSTWTSSMKQKVQNRRMGLRPGLPDLLVAIPGKGLLFIEMKRRKGGVVSDHQKHWLLVLNSIPGVEARVCKGSDEAIAFITEHYAPKGPVF